MMVSEISGVCSQVMDHVVVVQSGLFGREHPGCHDRHVDELNTNCHLVLSGRDKGREVVDVLRGSRILLRETYPAYLLHHVTWFAWEDDGIV